MPENAEAKLVAFLDGVEANLQHSRNYFETRPGATLRGVEDIDRLSGSAGVIPKDLLERAQNAKKELAELGLDSSWKGADRILRALENSPASLLDRKRELEGYLGNLESVAALNALEPDGVQAHKQKSATLNQRYIVIKEAFAKNEREQDVKRARVKGERRIQEITDWLYAPEYSGISDQIDGHITALNEAMKGDDAEKINEAAKKLQVTADELRAAVEEGGGQ